MRDVSGRCFREGAGLMGVLMGLDLSLTSSGWARMDGSGGVVSGTVRSGSSSRGAARLSYVCSVVEGLVDGSCAELSSSGVRAERVSGVVVEGYSFGSQGRATFSVGELGGAVRVRLFEMGVPFVEVSPALLKKFAVGSGQASKDEVLLAAARRGGSLFSGMSNDEADAFWLLVSGYEYLASRGVGGRLLPVPAVQAAALSKVDWSPFEGLVSGG